MAARLKQGQDDLEMGTGIRNDVVSLGHIVGQRILNREIYLGAAAESPLYLFGYPLRVISPHIAHGGKHDV